MRREEQAGRTGPDYVPLSGEGVTEKGPVMQCPRAESLFSGRKGRQVTAEEGHSQLPSLLPPPVNNRLCPPSPSAIWEKDRSYMLAGKSSQCHPSFLEMLVHRLVSFSYISISSLWISPQPIKSPVVTQMCGGFSGLRAGGGD